MSEKSKIEWTTATWNPVTGCTKVSQGCKHCYAEREWARLSGNAKTVYHGRKFEDIQYHPERLEMPLSWKKPKMVFVNSMSDLFHETIPIAIIIKIWRTMASARIHTFQILTKRPERAEDFLSSYGHGSMMHGRQLPLNNVWVGVSIESRDHLERMESLRRTHAAIRFISFEPLLGDIGTIDLTGIHWVIVGGESGPKARPMHPDWVRAIRDQCIEASVPFFLKQWGEWAPDCLCIKPCKTIARPTPEKQGVMFHCGKKAAGRKLDGITWDDMPCTHVPLNRIVTTEKTQ